MKLLSTIKDKLCAAIGLGLVCGALGLSTSAVPVEAESKQPKQPKQEEDNKGKHSDDKAKDGDSVKNDSDKPSDGSKPKRVNGLCPACGRG